MDSAERSADGSVNLTLAVTTHVVAGLILIGGLYVATGQFRNGILFAPAISDLLCNLLLGRSETPVGSTSAPL